MTLSDVSEILATATPGPWIADVRVGTVQVYAGPPRGCLALSERTVLTKHGLWVDDAWLLDPQDEADARAIVTAVNLAPALIAVAEAARRFDSGSDAGTVDAEVALTEALEALDVALGRTP